VAGGALAGAAAAAFVVVGAVLNGRRGYAGCPGRVLEGPGGEWFSGQAVDGFPMDAVRSWLLGPGAPSLNRLYTAWAFAVHGYGAGWIEQYLDLPAEAARLLAGAAARSRG
jgi:hypothetical protein